MRAVTDDSLEALTRLHAMVLRKIVVPSDQRFSRGGSRRVLANLSLLQRSGLVKKDFVLQPLRARPADFHRGGVRIKGMADDD